MSRFHRGYSGTFQVCEVSLQTAVDIDKNILRVRRRAIDLPSVCPLASHAGLNFEKILFNTANEFL